MWDQWEEKTETEIKSEKLKANSPKGVRKIPGQVAGDERQGGGGRGSSERLVTNGSTVDKGKYRTDHWIWPGAGPWDLRVVSKEC